MDKTWITSNRFSESYLKGVKTFIEYATEHVLEVDNTFRCPCVKCNNASYKTPDLVERDLHVNGFNHSYVEWIFHGEEEYRVIGDDLNSSNNDEDNDVTDSSPIDEFDEFFGDLREAVASDNSDDDWFAPAPYGAKCNDPFSINPI